HAGLLGFEGNRKVHRVKSTLKNPKGRASMAPPRSSTARARARRRNRNRTARIAVVLLAGCFALAWLQYVPELFEVNAAATLAGGLLTVACGVLALMARRNRLLRADVKRLDGEIEVLEDRNWELKEATERSQTFLEALGDVIVRRDASGAVTYANDAYGR